MSTKANNNHQYDENTIVVDKVTALPKSYKPAQSWEAARAAYPNTTIYVYPQKFTGGAIVAIPSQEVSDATS